MRSYYYSTYDVLTYEMKQCHEIETNAGFSCLVRDRFSRQNVPIIVGVNHFHY